MFTNPINKRFVAHRGANNAAPHNTLPKLPENSLPALEEAFRVGSMTVECDVHLTHDQRIIVLHDDTLRRTASYQPQLVTTLTPERFALILDCNVSDLTYEEISQVSIGAYDASLADNYLTATVPTLESFLAMLQNHFDRQLIIELKPGDHAIVAVLKKLVQHAMQKNNLQTQQLILISFDYQLIVASKTALPMLQHLFLTTATPDADEVRVDLESPEKTQGIYHRIYDQTSLQHCITLAKKAGLDGLDVEYDAQIDAAFIQAIHAANLRCAVWTYAKDDTIDMAKKMLAAGADLINTNQPEVIFNALA